MTKTCFVLTLCSVLSILVGCWFIMNQRNKPMACKLRSLPLGAGSGVQTGGLCAIVLEQTW